MRWRITARILAVLALGFLSMSLVTGIGGADAFYGWGFGLTPLSAGFAAMISFIGFVVVRFAAVQMRDEHEGNRFHRWLTAVLAAILFTAVSDHFLLFWLGWVGVSLSLHRLLLFYPERPRAQLAAHKKFIFARVAETSLGAALFGLWWQYDILRISELSATTLAGSLSGSEWIAILLAVVALLKCAQLPMHGWLLQVVEAPTAVSALLHAGIINLGGFLLLQFSPLLTDAPVARWLLAIIAGDQYAGSRHRNHDPHQCESAARLVNSCANGVNAGGNQPWLLHPGGTAFTRTLLLQSLRLPDLRLGR